jgi:hypothetical protein
MEDLLGSICALSFWDSRRTLIDFDGDESIQTDASEHVDAAE